ncbi:MAG: Rho termination factor N-terminal domain-containing protein, partial [Alphaproteobacteria bacterium]|nr:Rho termination factor N-terminal domain-containing protein [Alphaproteobacteria bacterium]
MNLKELKSKTPADLLAFAEDLQIENASTLRKQDMMFAILKQLADNDQAIYGDGVLEILSDGFGFLRSPEANYLPGPDDIYVSPSQVRRFGLRTGDTVEGQIRSPKDGERYFALLKVNTINFAPPENVRHRINFDNLTPLYPDARLKLELEQGAPALPVATRKSRHGESEGKRQVLEDADMPVAPPKGKGMKGVSDVRHDMSTRVI